MFCLFCCKTGDDEETKKAKQKLALEGQTSEANAELNDSNAVGQQRFLVSIYLHVILSLSN